jgi:hypothetical protein
MKKPIAGRVIALSAALATVATTSALALASDGVGGTSTRDTYVVGGEVVHPPAPHARAAGRTPASNESSPADSTRHGYVVGGALVEPAR